MTDSLASCDSAILEVSRALYKLEKKHELLLNIRSLMGQYGDDWQAHSAELETPPMRRDLRPTAALMLTIIERSPGLARKDIRAQMGDFLSEDEYTSVVQSLRRRGKIKNDGTKKNPKWYAEGAVIPPPPIDYDELFAIIRENPGINRTDLAAIFLETGDQDLTNALTTLRRRGWTVNIGTRKNPHWYANLFYEEER